MPVTPSLSDKLHALVTTSMHERWKPHPGQVAVGKAIFVDKVKNVFVQCGRKWGKSEFMLYVLIRWALLNPNSCCYYLGPIYKQVKEIVWAPRRAQNFVDRQKWVKHIDKQETRILYYNGSFLKIDGTDNYDAYRGITPDIVVLDETAECDPRFLEIMRPNLAPKDAPLIQIGTPPRHLLTDEGKPHHYILEAQRAREGMKTGRGFWIHQPSMANPYVDPEWFKRTREELYANGEGYVWEREYEARLVTGGARSVFPMFSEDKHYKPHHQLLDLISKDREHLRYYCVCDPGTTTCFAILFIAINPYNGVIYVLNEIYERDPLQTSVGRIWPRAEKIMAQLAPLGTSWLIAHDSAAAWFANELWDQFRVNSIPAPKREGTKEEGLSTLRDLLRSGEAGTLQKFFLSDQCPNCLYEIENCETETDGRIAKRNDHTIDILRYFLMLCQYVYYREEVKKRESEKSDRRMYSLEYDLRQEQAEDDSLYGSNVDIDPELDDSI